MVTTSENCKRADVNLAGGKGEVHIKHLTDKEGLYGHGRLFAHVTIDPGNSIGFHNHNHETEFYYIIKGEGVFSDNGKEVILRAGDCGATGYGEGHALENRTNEPLEMIALIVFEE
jgi:mannose-6-phosphate isomerase-like protein (cupin superfamily)